MQGDGFPHTVHGVSAITVVGQKTCGQIGALDFEAGFSRGVRSGAQVVQHASEEHGLTVVIRPRPQPVVVGEQFGEEEAAHAVVEHRRRLCGTGELEGRRRGSGPEYLGDRRHLLTGRCHRATRIAEIEGASEMMMLALSLSARVRSEDGFSAELRCGGYGLGELGESERVGNRR